MTEQVLDEDLLDEIFEEVMFRSVQEDVDMKNPQSKDALVDEVLVRFLGEVNNENTEIHQGYKQAVTEALFRSETKVQSGEGGYRRIRDSAQANANFSEPRQGK